MIQRLDGPRILHELPRFRNYGLPSGELRHGETTPLVRESADDASIHKWTDPERIMIVVAGGEAGRFSAVLGPCDGMGTRPITKEIRWNT